MVTNQLVRIVIGKLVTAAIMVLLWAAMMSAQVRTQQTVEEGPTLQTVTFERGEVVWVSGNDLIVKMDNGEVRHFPNVPESFRADIGGRRLSVHDLQPGMKLDRTTITNSTPRTITSVRSVTGTVWQINPPSTVILTLEDGKNQRFTIPKDQKIKLADGRSVDAFGLRKGMKVSATAVTESQERVVETQARVTGHMPAPALPPALAVVLIQQPTAAPVAAAPQQEQESPAVAQQLPKTGSLVPLIGLLGLMFCAVSILIHIFRRV